jgi:uncharacterized OsmC-like protein
MTADAQPKNVVNGIDMDAFLEAREKVAATEGASKGKKASRVRWMGGLQLKVHVRNHTFLVDEPPHLTGEDLAPNAVEYVLGSLGACYATGFILNASLRGVKVRNLELALDSTQDNVFQFLRLNDEGHSGLETIKVKLYVQADASPEVLQDIWKTTIETSPVGNSLSFPVNIEPELAIV